MENIKSDENKFSKNDIYSTIYSIKGVNACINIKLKAMSKRG